MTQDRRAAFLDGERTDDVALYLSADTVSNLDSLLDRPMAQSVDDGVVLVVDGKTGRSVFQRFTGKDAMEFAGAAMGEEGTVDATLDGGTCPDADETGTHSFVFVFAFAEEENEDAGGMYARGAVVHAYAQCTCGLAYSDKWVVDDR